MIKEINILTPEKREYIKNLHSFTMTKHILFTVGSLLIITSVVLYFTNLLLQNQINSFDSQILQEQNSIKQGKSASTESAIQQLNNQLTQAQQIQDKDISWLPILKSLTEIVPSTIHFNRLSLSTSNGTFSLSGTADSRNALLNFDEAIKKYQNFSDLIIPLIDVTQKSNITFDITGKFNITQNNASAN